MTVYAMALYQAYELSSGAITDEGGSHMAVAITFAVNEAGEYTVEEYWTPMDGSGYNLPFGRNSRIILGMRP